MLINSPDFNRRMAKKEFFRDKRISEITGGREVICPGAHDSLVDRINALAPDQALYIDFPILPKQFDNTRKFLKYGNEARAGVNPEAPPAEAIARALHDAQVPFGSIVVRSRLDRLTVTRTMLDTCIEGMKLYAYSVQNAPIKVAGPYRGQSVIKDFGAVFNVDVPSEERKIERHRVKLSNVPLYDVDSKKQLWTGIEAVCDCDFTRWWITGRYLQERLFCQHIVAAYYAVARFCTRNRLFKDQAAEDMKVPSWAVPFPIFSEVAVGYWNKMRAQVIVNTGKMRKPLNSGKRSKLLGDYTAAKGKETALWHPGDKKIIDYNWY